MILSFLLLMTDPVPAQQADCDEPLTQAAMNICSMSEFERADADMNSAWQDARSWAKEQDDAFEYDDAQPGFWPTLLDGQRAWLKFRDNHCRLVSYDARGGSLQPTLANSCFTDMTTARTHQLRDLLTNQVSGQPNQVPEE